MTGASANLLGDVVVSEALFRLLTKRLRPQQDLEAQVEEAAEALRRASELTTDLQQVIGERTKQLQQLQVDLERYRQLAQIEQRKAAAVVEELGQFYHKSAGRERWVAFAINVVAGLLLLIIGVAVSEPLKDVWSRIEPGVLRPAVVSTPAVVVSSTPASVVGPAAQPSPTR